MGLNFLTSSAIYNPGRAFHLPCGSTNRSARAMTEQPRRLRADAARNRAAVLEVAYEMFASEGLAVPIDEIARRAGVGAGTVYRHFSTKEALFQAILTEQVGLLVDSAHELAATVAPEEALFHFFALLVDAALKNHGFVDALAGTEFDITHSAPEVEGRFVAALDELLRLAQQSGAVRTDIVASDVKTLLVGYQAMQRYAGDAPLNERVVAVLKDGLAARS